MWIKRVELENFQKHERFSADFTSGVNVICGESDKGKSCIIRALMWVLFNEPKGDSVRRINSDATSVKIFLDSGFSITKVKSDSQNAYIIEENGSEKRYDAVGKIIPDDVKKVLGVCPMNVDGDDLILNVALQLAPAFMLDKKAYSPSFRMKVFNKLTGNDLLDSVSQSFNKDILKIGRDQKLFDTELETLRSEHEQAEKKIEHLEGILFPATEGAKALKPKINRYLKVLNLFETLQGIRASLKITGDGLKSVDVPSDSSLRTLRSGVDRFEKVRYFLSEKTRIKEGFAKCQIELKKIKYPDDTRELKERIKNFLLVETLFLESKNVKDGLLACKGALSRIIFPDNIDSLGKRVERFGKVSQLLQDRRLKESTYKTLIARMEFVGGEILEYTEEYKGILKQYQKCPTCHQEISDDILERIEL